MTRLISAVLAFALFIAPQSLLAETRSVASSADQRASEAGAEILGLGGSAADAAMAMMLALTVVEPQSSGIGGGGFLIHHSGSDGALTTVNGRETAPAAAKADRFTGPDGKPLGFLAAFQGGHSVGVPGNIRLMAMTHAKWGKLPWADIFAPAIRLAEEGFIVNKTMESRLQLVSRLWPQFPETRKLYWRDGKPVTAGMRITNPALAKTLKEIAAQGPDAFYTGEIARSIVDAVQSAPVNKADMTMSDLARYKAKEQAAVCAPYRAYVVCGMGPPSSGATTVLQILGTLAPFDMKALGKDNAQSWHLIAEAMQLAYADRQKYLGDDAFVNVPVAGMLDPEYLATRSAMINLATSRADYPAGNPPGASPRTAAVSSEVAGTTHFTAVDKDGNIANMTSTIEGPFGSQLIASGFFLNNELTDFTFAPEKDGAPVANRVQAGKRPLSSMSPTLVFDADGKAVMALGSAGGKRIIMHVAKTLIGAIDFGLPLGEAIALPNIYYRRNTVLVENGTMLADMAADLAKYGAEVKAADIGSKVNGAQLTADGWRGASDARSEGVAITLDADGKEVERVGKMAEEAPPASVF
ncbi:MAG: gamma-glutamyltransferase [Sphingorhabdus sp.]